MAVSTDGGKTFTDRLVHQGPAGTSYGHQFVNVTIDQAGTVYSVYSDDRNTYMSYSTDQGTSWSAPVKVNSVPTAIEPWAVALAPGKIDIVYYGSSYSAAGVTPDNYPSSASWTVYLAQNTKAASGGKFRELAATPVVHYGGVCESGISCTGNRDLFDDFGVAASPSTGLASIIYSDDQYTNDGAPGHARGPARIRHREGVVSERACSRSASAAGRRLRSGRRLRARRPGRRGLCPRRRVGRRVRVGGEAHRCRGGSPRLARG